MTSEKELTSLYKKSHNIMRDIDGLQPQEAFDELLKFMFFKQNFEEETAEKNPKSTELNIDDIHLKFKKYLNKNVFAEQIWRDYKIHLSDECLNAINELFSDINFSTIPYDIRSHALKEFLTPEIRKGLGIFLTPDSVVSSIVSYLPITEKSSILDPACGSATFLIEILKKLQGKTNRVLTIDGVDKSPRMLMLAELNIGHTQNVVFNGSIADSLRSNNKENKYDFILTNPPFGMALDAKSYNFDNFETCKDAEGYTLKKQNSEIVFIEQCIKLLKPEGTLAIVIPKSIITNNTLQHARNILAQKGYVYTIMCLPPETFATTGTQTTTVVLFIKKYKTKSENKDKINLAVANISNVGFDSTGRPKKGSQLDSFCEFTKNCLEQNKSKEFVNIFQSVKKSDTFKNLSSFLQNQSNKKGTPLKDLCSYICTGKTPARKDYADEGEFLIKVGNLSGAGINWLARDRNFISDEDMTKRKNARKPLILQPNDILLTSSAHSPVYIAKKCDIFTGTPDFVDGDVSFVGEVMMIRPNTNKIDPYLLLAYLRNPETVSEIQSMVRGQTAHLHSKDIGELLIPESVFDKNSPYNKIATIIKEQTKLNQKINHLADEQWSLYKAA